MLWNFSKNNYCLPVFFLSLFLVSLVTVEASTESELRARIDARNREIIKLEEEITAYQKTLSQTAEESRTLENEIYRAETQIKKLTVDIRLTETRIGATELALEELDMEIKDKETRILSQRTALSATLKIMYEEETDSLIELLLKNKDISEFFGSLEDLQTLEESIHGSLNDLRELKSALEVERQSRETHRTKLANLQEELADRRVITSSAKEEKDALLTVTKSKEERYQELLEEREKQRQATLAEIQQIEDELRKRIDLSALPNAQEGVLAWPLKGNMALTQSFGTTPDSKILYNGKPHNGIDLRASVGTPLFAADTGVVKEIGNTDAFTGCLSYGKWILIEHPNNLATLYAHLSRITVTPGAMVERGEQIGYTGNTGYATGPHLHFTVYDASTVQFRQSKIAGSRCEYLPYGGYLNPLAYL